MRKLVAAYTVGALIGIGLAVVIAKKAGGR